MTRIRHEPIKRFGKDIDINKNNKYFIHLIMNQKKQIKNVCVQ